MKEIILGKPIKSGSGKLLRDDFNFCFQDWSVHKNDNGYFFRFLAARQAGIDEIKITKEEYLNARNMLIDKEYLFNKYGRTGKPV